ncbi:unnamed protein product, partial [marine sediment metagenome]
ITERVRAEEQIKASLAEKTVLLKEIHHRVKNSLQTVVSLLNLQANRIEDEQMLSIIRESQSRVFTMALIHEELYQSTNLARVDFSRYVQGLVSQVFYLYDVSAADITIQADVEEVALDIDTAVWCGLIVNELVSNSLKHAFPEGRSGVVRVELRPEEDKYFLMVSDTGVGLPEDLDWQNTDTLGLYLVNTMVGGLSGEIELDCSEGTKFKITFPVSKES